MAKEKIVSPMPFPHDRPACILVPPGGERWTELFIVQVPGGVSRLHAEPYMNFLAERVAWMLRRSPDEDDAMAELRSLLKQAKLLDAEPRKSTPGLFCIDCIATNANLLARVRTTLGTFPMEVMRGDHSAVTVLLRTGINDWLASFKAWMEETRPGSTAASTGPASSSSP